jgi:hypothetical protein
MYLSHGLDNKRKISAPALILTLLFTALAGSLLISSANANPVGLYYPKSSPPIPVIKAAWLDARIPVMRPVNLTLEVIAWAVPWKDTYGGNDVIRFSDYDPDHVYSYTLSPLQVWLDGNLLSEYDWRNSIEVLVFLEEIGDGWHTVEVTATASGEYSQHGIQLGSSRGSSGEIRFLVDNSPPSISVLGLDDKICSVSDVPLTLKVDEAISQLKYSLDGQDNVTIAGNTTLVGLSEGSHSIKVYGGDVYGYTGVSETVTFAVVRKAFPITLIGTVIIVSAAAVSFGLMPYFLRRKKRKTT